MRLAAGALLGLALMAQAASAEVYRWVDAEGNVHFSDKKPPGRTAEEVEIQTRQPAEEPDEGELRRLALVREAEERFRETVKLLPPPGDSSAGSAADCADARRNYGVLQEPMPVYQADDGTYRPQWQSVTYQGGRLYVADEDREQVKAEVWEDVVAYCDRPDDLDALDAAYDAWFAREHCEISRQRLEKAEREEDRTPDGVIERLRAEYRSACLTVNE